MQEWISKLRTWTPEDFQAVRPYSRNSADYPLLCGVCRCLYANHQHAIVLSIFTDTTSTWLSHMTRLWTKNLNAFMNNGAIDRIVPMLGDTSCILFANHQANLSPKAPMIIFETGLIGISLTKAAEVKCLHAHLADYLMRGDVNPIGPLVVEDLAGML